MSVYQINQEIAQDILVDNEVPLEASNDSFDIRGSDNTLINCKTIDTRCRTSAHCFFGDVKEFNSDLLNSVNYLVNLIKLTLMELIMTDRIVSKKCNQCRLEKKLSDFRSCQKGKGCKLNLRSSCRPCETIKKVEYRRSQNGTISKILQTQRSTSKKRGNQPPEYTRKEITKWIYENGFYAVWCQWNWSNFARDYVPSIDRLNDYEGYKFGNIRLVTWIVNNTKNHRQSYEGLSKKNIKIKQLTKENVFIKTHLSASVASRQLNISRSNITACCRGSKPSAGGFRWVYA